MHNKVLRTYNFSKKIQSHVRIIKVNRNQNVFLVIMLQKSSFEISLPLVAALWSISSNSVTFMVSPSSLATLLMLLTLMNPLLSSSKRSKILLMPFQNKKENYSRLFIAQSCSDAIEELFEVNFSSFSFKVGDHVENCGIFSFKAK